MASSNDRWNSPDSNSPQPALNGSVSALQADSKDAGEDKRYAEYYERIYPLLRQGQLNFEKISAQAGMKERRVREILLYRLMPGDMVQVMGRKEGICYLCSTRMHGLLNKEPLCLLCLKNITLAVDSIHTQESELHTPDSDAIEPEQILPEPSPMGNTVSLAQYEALLQELQQYRDKYGALPAPDEDAPTRPIVEATYEKDCLDDLPTKPQPICADETSDPLLNLLGMDNIAEPPTGIPVSDSNAPIRHYGFQRIRPRH